MNKTVVETLCYYSKLWSRNEFWLRDQAKEEIQELIDRYTADGFELVSTDAHQFVRATYIYLYFSKSAS